MLGDLCPYVAGAVDLLLFLWRDAANIRPELRMAFCRAERSERQGDNESDQKSRQEIGAAHLVTFS